MKAYKIVRRTERDGIWESQFNYYFYKKPSYSLSYSLFNITVPAVGLLFAYSNYESVRETVSILNGGLSPQYDLLVGIGKKVKKKLSPRAVPMVWRVEDLFDDFWAGNPLPEDAPFVENDDSTIFLTSYVPFAVIDVFQPLAPQLRAMRARIKGTEDYLGRPITDLLR